MISEIAIRRPVLAWMLMTALILFGGLCFFKLGISQLPDIDFPVVNISLTLNNAAPEVIENDVVDPVEDAVMGIEGIRSVTSNSSQGQANVTVEFELGRNVDVALQEVQTRIAQAKKSLPQKLDPPVITKTNPEDLPILWVMLTADPAIPLNQQMMYARNTLKDKFSIVSGVGDIQLGGYVEPNLRIHLNPQKLREFDLTADDITNAIASEQLELPAGRVEDVKKEFNVRLLGEAASPEEFGKIRILKRSGAMNFRPIHLNQVARIEEGLADIRKISRYNGISAVGLGIVKQRGSNAVKVADSVIAKVQDIRTTLPKGYKIDVRMDSTKYIRDSVSELNFTLVLSALLTSFVCLLFLGSWSSTINVLFSIPTSIVGAFIFLYFFKFTLNTFTLLGLSLAIGIVVDDAIMMLENIIRHREMGSSRRKAALDGSKEITFAAIAATVAIAAIFVPVIFMQGVIGRFFYQFGVTVTVAVFLSLLEALTLTPMRCSQMLGEHHSGSLSWMDRLMNRTTVLYQATLKTALRFKYLILTFSILLFVVSMVGVRFLNKELMPEQDQSQFLLTLRAPVGTSMVATDLIFKKAEAYLSEQKGVLEYFSSIGNYQGQDIVNQGTLFITLVDAKKRNIKQSLYMRKCREELRALLPDVQIFAQDLSLSGFSASRGYPIEFTIQGNNWGLLKATTQEVMDLLNKQGLVEDLNTDIQDDMPELQIIPDRNKAADRGVNMTTIGSAVSTMIGGTIFTSSTQYPKNGHRYDIRVRSEKEFHDKAGDLLNIFIHNNRGALVDLMPLTDVARVEEHRALSLISRMNRERAIPVFANVKEGKSQQAVLDYLEEIGRTKLPTGLHISITGSAQTFRESFDGLIFALLLGIVVAYMILASQFNSYIHPITVLLALPFSLSGAFLALIWAHQSINLFSMIGLILLMGIVKKNSILLVDFANAKRKLESLTANDALLSACPLRLRPILMTSFATVAGAIPAAISFGPGSETRVPMAVAIIGGVLLSTFLTLIVVPCAYSIFARFEKVEDSE